MHKNPLNNIIIITLACLLVLRQLCPQYTSIFRLTEYTLRPAVSAGTITAELAGAMEVGNSRDSAKARSAGSNDGREEKKARVGPLCDQAGAAFRAGSHNEAISLIKQALKIHTELGQPQKRALDMRLIGANYFKLELYKDAANYCERSAKLYEQLANKSGITGKQRYEMKEQACRAWSLAANAYSELSRTDEKAWYGTIRCLENCIRLNKALKLRKMTCKARTILGNVYMEIGKFREAAREFEASARMEERLGDTLGAAKGYAQAAIAFEHNAVKNNDLSSYKKAAVLNKKSAELNAKRRNPDMAIKHYLYAAIDYEKAGDTASSEECRQRADEVVQIIIRSILKGPHPYPADTIRGCLMRRQSRASDEARNLLEALLDSHLDLLAAMNEQSRPWPSEADLGANVVIAKLMACSA